MNLEIQKRASTKNQPRISIVSTLYRSSSTVVEFIKSVSKVASQITDQFEIVLVDDGSPDNSFELCKNYDAPIKVINFSKNYGHHMAMMAGIEHAKGEYIFLIDSDLEESPSLFWSFGKNLKRILIRT